MVLDRMLIYHQHKLAHIIVDPILFYLNLLHLVAMRSKYISTIWNQPLFVFTNWDIIWKVLQKCAYQIRSSSG